MRPSRAFLFLLQVACATSAVRPAETPPEASLPKSVRPTHYELALRIDPDQKRFGGVTSIDVQLDEPRAFLWMNGRGLNVTAATADGEPAKYEQVTDDGVVKLTLPRTRSGPIRLRFEYDAPFDSRLTGLYVAPEAGTSYAFTQFEAIDARKAFPGFDDPQFKTPFDVTITAKAADEIVANTLPVGTRDEGATKTVRFATTKPLPTYLLNWSVGPFDVVAPPPLPPNEVRHTPLQIRGIAPRGRGKELAYAMQAGGELLVALERYFGIAFPYDKLDQIAVPDYPYGAMENAGAITYRESLLLAKPGEDGLFRRRSIAEVMAHEMAHQWFGDLVTLRWWNDAWLNEAFATWMGNHVVEAWQPALGGQTELLRAINGAMGADALASARAVRKPVLRNADIWNSFDGLTYQKGAGVLLMFEHYVGPAQFREAIHAYLEAHAYGGGSTDELLAAFSRAAGRDVAGPMRSFLDQAGVPLVEAELSCQPGAARLKLRQSRYAPAGVHVEPGHLWGVPVCARHPGGVSCTMLTGAEGELPLGSSCPAWILPNADATGYYRWALAPADLQKLAGAPLNEREKISLAQNLRASVASGALPFSAAMKTLEPLARDGSGEIAVEPIGALRRADFALLDDSGRERLRAYASRLYQPVVARLGWDAKKDDRPEDVRLRTAVLDFLVHTAHDPAQSAEAARRGAHWFGKTAPEPSAVAPELIGVALPAWVREGGAQAFDAVAARLRTSTDTAERGHLIRALASVDDPALAERALSLVMDARLRKNERLMLLGGLISRRETREAAWTWLQPNFDALVQAIPENHAARVPAFVADFCDDAHVAAFERFFTPRVERIASAPQYFRESVESARSCVAQRAVQHADAARFFLERTASR